MPSSDLNYLVDVLAAAASVEPKSILEIGPGFGKYGFLLRELLDLKAGPHGGYAPFQRRIDAIEVDERYLTPVHSYVYDEVFVGDASKVLASLPRRYDLVLIVDVIEHFPKVPAFELMMAAMKVAPSLVIATPYLYYPQGVVFDNPHEEHLCGFFPSELRDGGAAYMWRKGLGLIAMFTQQAVQLPPARATGDGPFTAKDHENLHLMAQMYRRTGQWAALGDAGRRALAVEPGNAHFRAWMDEAAAR